MARRIYSGANKLGSKCNVLNGIVRLVIVIKLGCVCADSSDDDDNDTNDTNGTNDIGESTITNTTTTITTTTSTLEIKTVFLRLGDGECLAPASQPVRGVARRDIDHGTCHDYCFTEDCLGYSYAPCERICTVYGDPGLLLQYMVTSEWNANSGWGQISHSTGQCGSACFLRTNPCWAGDVMSAGATIGYWSFNYGTNITSPCPFPFRGAMDLYCGVSGVEVISGRCLRQCDGGAYYDRSFEVFYPPSRHGDLVSGDCPRGAQGNITMQCIDGKASYAFGRCGYNCQQGSLRAGSAIVMYNAMYHQSEHVLDCPDGWIGAPVLRCFDSMVKRTSGTCYKHCDGGKILLRSGASFGDFTHPRIDHNTSLTDTCPPGAFTGTVTAFCSDGQTTLVDPELSCQRNCMPGEVSSYGDPNDAISERRNVSHGFLNQREVVRLQCNQGYMEYPPDLLYLIGVTDQFIYKTPWDLVNRDTGYGVIVNEYFTTISISIPHEYHDFTKNTTSFMYAVGSNDFRIYRQPIANVHPTSFWGEPISKSMAVSFIAVSGNVIFAVGLADRKAYRQNLETMLIEDKWDKLTAHDKNLTALAVSDGKLFASIASEARIYYQDQLTPFEKWIGPISCINIMPISSVIVFEGWLWAVADQMLWKQKIANMSENSPWIGPLSGKQRILDITVGTSVKNAETGVLIPGFAGSLKVQCVDGQVNLLSGACMMHCDKGFVISNNVLLNHTDMSHGETKTTYCPGKYTGALDVTCADGRIFHTGSCGLNCEPFHILSNEANVSIPAILHSDDENAWNVIDCPGDHLGNISVRCFMGQIRWNGQCLAPCPGGEWSRKSAIINYPQIKHGGSYTGKCIAKFGLSYSGSVTFGCENGELVTDGGCNPDCTAGEIKNYIPVFHGDILVDTTVSESCGLDPMFGIVQILCQRGEAKIVNGTCGIPCRAGMWSAAATGDWPMQTPDIAHQAFAWVKCPPQVSGMLHLSCMDNALTAINGSCGERCQPETFEVYGANFNSPLLDHLEHYEQPCMDPYDGHVDINCTNGLINVSSGCLQGCWGGVLEVPGGAKLSYPDMVSGDQYLVETCPDGYAGSVTLECGDLKPFVREGSCEKHCVPSRFYQEFYNVAHELILHGHTVLIDCDEGFDGDTTLECQSGNVTLKYGGCSKRCPNGRYQLRLGISLRHARLAHLEMGPFMECPANFYGRVALKCTNGEIGVGAGGCPANCEAGKKKGVRHGVIRHGTEASWPCPESGSKNMTCTDGKVNVVSGTCYKDCVKNIMSDKYWTQVLVGDFKHGMWAMGNCSKRNSTGQVRALCTDGVVTLDPVSDNERCFRHCEVQPIITSDNTTLSAPEAYHLDRAVLQCPEGQVGKVYIQCVDSIYNITFGHCGPENCPAGKQMVWQTTAGWDDINDLTNSTNRSRCNNNFFGDVLWSCNNATIDVINTTLLYPAVAGYEPYDWNFSNLTNLTPEVEQVWLEHNNDIFLLCGCCNPPAPPEAVAPIKGVDMRKIMYWAIAVLSGGTLLSAVAGAWGVKPRRCGRKKKSAIHPSGDGESPERADSKEGIREETIVPYSIESDQPTDIVVIKGHAYQKPTRDAYDKEMPPDW